MDYKAWVLEAKKVARFRQDTEFQKQTVLCLKKKKEIERTVLFGLFVNVVEWQRFSAKFTIQARK